jgi:hypothetical protein
MSGKWISIGRSPLLTLRESATVTESTFPVLRATRHADRLLDLAFVPPSVPETCPHEEPIVLVRSRWFPISWIQARFIAATDSAPRHARVVLQGKIEFVQPTG